MNAELFPLETTSIFGVTAGSGLPVLCMHGITANAYVFEPIIGLLADRFHVVSIDQRGHGRSGRPDSYAAADYAADVAALIRHLALGPVFLLGHSLGARNALVAANRYPELVRGVVAVDFTPYIETGVFDALEARVLGGDRAFPDRKQVEAYLAARYPHVPADAIARRAQHGYREEMLGYRPLADPRAMALTVAGLRENLEDAVRNVKPRTLLVRGANSKLVSEEAWAKTRALRPELEAVEVADADHYVPEEQPAAIADLVRRIATARA
jgi:2-(acetamidomethylene)succinate hydrolase